MGSAVEDASNGIITASLKKVALIYSFTRQQKLLKEDKQYKKNV